MTIRPGLRTERVRIVEREGPTPGRVSEADVIRCGGCGSTIFALFELASNGSLHLQCVTCDTSYCRDGKCDDLDQGAPAARPREGGTR